MASQHYNETLTDWHNDPPKLSMTVYIDTDGDGKMTYNGYIGGEGSFYNYHLYFFACNDSSGYDYHSYHNMAYLGEFAPNTNGGSMVAQSFTFNLTDVGLDKSKPTYIYYYCFNSWGSVSPGESGYPAPADSGFVCTIPALLSAPYMGTLVNANKKKNSDGTEDSGVSAASNSITVRGDLASDSDDASYWRSCRTIPPYLNDYDHRTQYGDVTESHSRYCIDTFKANITPRTTYTIYVYPGNSAGDQDVAKYINIRTLSDPPTMSAKAKSRTLNSVTFTWTSNYDLNKVYYQYKTTGNWSSEYSQGIDGKKTGDITISGIEPNTTVYIRVKGTENLDDQTSSYPENAHASQTTYDIASTEISTAIIHSGTINLSNTKNPSGNTMTLVMYDGNDTIASWDIATNTNSVSLSEAQWDNVYRRYGNSNIKNYSFYLYTANDSGTWNSYNRNVTRTVTLTGIQKTTHVGAGGPKRAMVWYSENGVMKHAVVWVGAGGGTKRTI